MGNDILTNINNNKKGAEAQELSNGSHMFLFAIRLPQVNYPPSMHDSPFGHRISYTLQGVFDTTGTTHVTTSVPIIYLPLITCSPNTLNETSKKTQVFEKEDKKIEVTAELIKPAYCPGKKSDYNHYLFLFFCTHIITRRSLYCQNDNQ